MWFEINDVVYLSALKLPYVLTVGISVIKGVENSVCLINRTSNMHPKFFFSTFK